jgi:ArsR family transcriptional regulator, arsenate/arsenite/antimonite-responsive transcriptional repressor
MTGAEDATFRALADQTRREILRLLRPAPLSSGEIAAHFATSWPTISRHLAVLRSAGLVTTQRQGQEIIYELNTSVFEDVIQHLMDWLKPAVRGGQHAKQRTDRGRVRGKRAAVLETS